MYIGNNLQVANPSYKIIDDISSGFDGSTTSFALQVSGATPVPFPISTQQVMISVNGVVQEPDPSGSAGFKLLGSNIVFSSAPANGHAFFGTILAGADYVTAGSEFPDGSVTAPSFTFEDDQDSGWYRISSGSVGYTANGVGILNFDGNGLTIASGKGLTVDTSTLKVDATNNRVGIGTASPTSSLHVSVGSSGTNSSAGYNELCIEGADEDIGMCFLSPAANNRTHTIAFGDSNNNNAGKIQYNHSTDDLTITAADNIILTCDALGIGVTPNSNWPSNGDFKGLQIGTGGVLFGRGSGDEDRSGIAANWYNSGSGNKYLGNGNANRIYMQDGNITFETAAANSSGADAALTFVESMRIDSSGRLLVAHTASIGGEKLQVNTTGASPAGFNSWYNGADPAYLYLRKSRGGSAGTYTVVQDDDGLGAITFAGGDGDSFANGARILASVDGTPGDGDMPARLTFHTSADGTTNLTERMRIDSSGNVLIGTTTAGAEFHVKGGGTVAKFEGTGGSGFISLADADDSTQLFLGCDGGNFKIQTSGNSWADKLTVNQAGHLGLKTAPNAGWSVSTDINVLQLKHGVLWDYAGVQTDLGQNFYYTGSGYKFIRGDYSTRITQHCNDGHIGFWSGGTGSADGDITWAERMHITADGKLLLGTTTEGHSNADNLTIADSGNAGISIRSGTSSYGSLYFSDATSGADEYMGVIEYHHTSNSLKFYSNASTALTLDSSQNATFAGTVSDSKGNLRNIPQNYKTSAYTLVAADAGKHIYYSGSAAAITVPSGVFSTGDAITIISANSSTDITIVQSGTTIYFANDGSSGTRTLASKGIATLICVSSNVFAISGAGLS